MYPSVLRIKGSSDSCSMSQVAEENVASAQVPAVSELEALGTLRNKNNMFEFLCGKYYLSMSNTICFLSQTSCCFLWEEISGSNITWKCICLYVLPLSFPFAVRPRPRCKQRLWRLRSCRVGRPHVPRAVLTCTCTYQVRIEFQFVSKQLRLECKERTHAGNCIWYWIAIPLVSDWSLLWLTPYKEKHLKTCFGTVSYQAQLPFAHHGGCQDYRQSILPDEGLDWTSIILCNSATLWFFTFWMPHFPFAALGGCGSRERFDLRGHASYFLILFRSSTDWWWENERWSVVGNYTVKQNLLHIYIYCSLLQFLADCFPWRMRRLSSTRTGNNIARWRTGLAKHDSVQLCNSLIFHFLDATPLAALGGCGSRERFDLRGHASYFLILFRSSTDWWWENERWSVVGNYTVKQNLLHIYIYCSLLQFLADCFPWRMPRLSLTRTGNNIARWRTGLAKHDSVQLCNSLIFHFLDAKFSSCCTRRMRKSQKIRSARTWVLFSNFFGHLSIGGERMRGGW